MVAFFRFPARKAQGIFSLFDRMDFFFGGGKLQHLQSPIVAKRSVKSCVVLTSASLAPSAAHSSSAWDRVFTAPLVTYRPVGWDA